MRFPLLESILASALFSSYSNSSFFWWSFSQTENLFRVVHYIHTFISLNLSITIVCTKVSFLFFPYSLWLIIHNINTGGHQSSRVHTSRETNTTGIKEILSLSDVCRHKADEHSHVQYITLCCHRKAVQMSFFFFFFLRDTQTKCTGTWWQLYSHMIKTSAKHLSTSSQSAAGLNVQSPQTVLVFSMFLIFSSHFLLLLEFTQVSWKHLYVSSSHWIQSMTWICRVSMSGALYIHLGQR